MYRRINPVNKYLQKVIGMVKKKRPYRIRTMEGNIGKSGISDRVVREGLSKELTFGQSHE